MHTIYRKQTESGVEYGYTQGNTLGGYDLAVLITISETQQAILDGLESERKEDRVNASKLYSALLGS